MFFLLRGECVMHRHLKSAIKIMIMKQLIDDIVVEKYPHFSYFRIFGAIMYCFMFIQHIHNVKQILWRHQAKMLRICPSTNIILCKKDQNYWKVPPFCVFSQILGNHLSFYVYSVLTRSNTIIVKTWGLDIYITYIRYDISKLCSPVTLLFHVCYVCLFW